MGGKNHAMGGVCSDMFNIGRGIIEWNYELVWVENYMPPKNGLCSIQMTHMWRMGPHS